MITFADSIFLRKMRMAAPISDETASILAGHLEECHFHKKELILREGIFCRYVWLLEKGFVRHYWVVNGEEATTSFSTEGTPIFSMDEMYYGKPSEEYAQAMEPVHAWRIKVGELEQLLRDNLELATHNSPERIQTRPQVFQRETDFAGKGTLPHIHRRISGSMQTCQSRAHRLVPRNHPAHAESHTF